MTDSSPWQIQLTSFEEILPFWKNHLWPGRQSKIEPASALNDEGQIDLQLLEQPVFFWKAVAGDQVIGVVSGQVTGPSLRSRGLWVHPEWRQKGVGRDLIRTAAAKAKDLGFQSLWSMPRISACEFYEKIGFKMEKTLDGFEFGPHRIARLSEGISNQIK